MVELEDKSSDRALVWHTRADQDEGFFRISFELSDDSDIEV